MTDRRLLPGLLLALVMAALLPCPPAVAEPGYRWPLAGTAVVERGFEPPRTAWGAGHRGVDLRASLGTPVLAAGAGRVSYAGLLAGRGVVVVVHDSGLRTTYEPVVARVSVGQRVAVGALLGTVSTGHDSCPPGATCLHWGLLRGETYLDPLSLLGRGQLRLLPFDDGTAGAEPIRLRSQAPPAHPASHARSAQPAGVSPRALVPSAAIGMVLAGLGVARGRTRRA